MSEISISREDSIILLRCSATDILGQNAKGWENVFIERSYYALDKAISDMEKLEKIEEIINDNGYTNPSDFVIRGLAYDEIEKIVKG